MCTIVLLPCQHASSIIYNYIYIFKPICPPHNSYLRSLPNRDVFWAKIWTAERSGIDSNECRNKCLAKCRPSNCIASCQPWLHGFMMVNIQLYRNCLASKLSSSWIIMYVIPSSLIIFIPFLFLGTLASLASLVPGQSSRPKPCPKLLAGLDTVWIEPELIQTSRCYNLMW